MAALIKKFRLSSVHFSKINLTALFITAFSQLLGSVALTQDFASSGQILAETPTINLNELDKNPTAAQTCPKCVLLGAATKNTLANIIGVFATSYKLNGEIEDLNKSIVEGEAYIQQLLALAEERAKAGDSERAEELRKLAREQEEAMNSIKNEFRVLGFPVL